MREWLLLVSHGTSGIIGEHPGVNNERVQTWEVDGQWEAAEVVIFGLGELPARLAVEMSDNLKFRRSLRKRCTYRAT